MITVVLQDKFGVDLAEVAEQGNEAYLRKAGEQFPLLSELSNFSPDLFGGTDIPELLAELELIKVLLGDSKSINHVTEIQKLAVRAAAENGAVLLFTPFSKDVRLQK